MKISKVIGKVLQGVFLQSAGSWGASITLDADGKTIDEFEEKRQRVTVRRKSQPNAKKPNPEDL